MDNPWKKGKSEIVYRNGDYFSIREDKVIRPDGKKGKYAYMDVPNPTVAVLPVIGDTVFLIRQWLYTLGAEKIEIVAGGANRGEKISQAAFRELREETGIVSSHLQEFALMNPSAGVSNQASYIFLARDLVFGPCELDPTEKIEMVAMDIKKAMKMIDERIITDSHSIVALQKYFIGRMRDVDGNCFYKD